MAAGCQYDKVTGVTGKPVSLVNDEGDATRDRGEKQDNGKLTIVGRLENDSSVAGEGIQPEEVERVIAAHPAVFSCPIVPVATASFAY